MEDEFHAILGIRYEPFRNGFHLLTSALQTDVSFNSKLLIEHRMLVINMWNGVKRSEVRLTC